MKKILIISAIIFVALMAFLSFYDVSYEKELFLMDTVCKVQISGKNSDQAGEEIKRELERISHEFSVNSDGALNKYNEGGNLTDELMKIVDESKKISDLTNGAFDITLRPVSLLWGFTTGNYSVPTESEIKEALTLTGYDKIGDGALIDLGGIAKGYAEDKVREILTKYGIKNATVTLGGTVLVYGEKAQTVAIQSPFDDSVFATMEVKNKVISTSGGYERNFTDEGKTYSHIIGRDGYPVDNEISSVTVIADSGAMSDALSTALFVMGESEAIKLYQKEDFEFIIIKDTGEILASEGIANDLFAKEITVIKKEG